MYKYMFQSIISFPFTSLLEMGLLDHMFFYQLIFWRLSVTFSWLYELTFLLNERHFLLGQSCQNWPLLIDNSNPNRKEVLSNYSLFLSSIVIHKFKHVFLYLLIFYLLWWLERKLSPNGVALGVTWGKHVCHFVPP